jgi:dTDP-4-amino-4,6-dideoxygalactose transaminase
MELVRHLSTTARASQDYDHDQLGYNTRMTNLQAAVGCAQLERLDELLAAKRRIAARYDEAFADAAALRPFPRADWAESANWFAGVVVDRGSAVTADEMIATLIDGGIGARRFWKPMHLQTPFADCPRGGLAVTEGVWRDIVTLPCSTGLGEDDQGRVIEAVRSALAASPPRRKARRA